MLDVTKRYTHKEFLDHCGRYWTKTVWGGEKSIEWFMENGHNTIVRPPEHKYYMSDKRGKDMRRPFYCEFFLDTRDELQHKFKENQYSSCPGNGRGTITAPSRRGNSRRCTRSPRSTICTPSRSRRP